MEVLSPLDAAMMTGELLSSPLNMGAVLILAPPDGAEGGWADQVYRDAAAARFRVERRLRRRPHRGLDTAGVWVWREDDAIDLEEHFRCHTLPGGSGRAGLWRLIGELHAERLDRSRPMWAAHLIDGVGDGRVALYVKIHHTLLDGVAGLRMISEGLAPDPDRRNLPPFYCEDPAALPGEGPGSGRDGVPDLLAPLRWLAGSFGRSATLLEHAVVGQARSAVDTVTQRTAAPAIGSPYTPFNRRLGRSRGVVADSWPKSRIRAVQDAAGVKGNDVLVTVVAGVLREWLADHGELPDRSLVALCPITVRAHDDVDDRQGGNMFGAWLCPIGTDLADPARRLESVHRSMFEGKRYVARYGAAVSMSLLVPSIATTIFQALTPVGPKRRTGYNVPISNVPGPRRELYWNGAHVEEIFPVSTIYDGQTLNVTACSYAGRVGIGYVADGAVMPDIDRLIPLTERCLRELEAAVGVAPAD